MFAPCTSRDDAQRTPPLNGETCAPFGWKQSATQRTCDAADTGEGRDADAGAGSGGGKHAHAGGQRARRTFEIEDRKSVV